MSKLHDARTADERMIGRRQRYVHADIDPLLFQRGGRLHFRKNPTPRAFLKPRGLKPVRGGRWGVRKLACNTPNGWQWEAYCRGTMKGATGRFPTQALAVAHAQRMAALARVMGGS